jgi:glycosyltransferase involved in cell wall biosynthesis
MHIFPQVRKLSSIEMRLLHVVPTYLPATRYGGPIYSVHGLCRALVGLGHEVHVFTTSVDGDEDSDVSLGQAVEVDGVKVWYFASKVLRRLYFAPALLRELRGQVTSFDLVHMHSVFLWPTWAAARVAWAAGVPYILSPRGMLVKELILRRSRWVKTAWIKMIEMHNIEHAATIHVTSGREKEELRALHFRLPEIWTIPNGIAMPESWSEDALSDDVRAVVQQGGYVLFFGRISWEKGLDRLLAAWREVPGTRLVIAGNDEENYLPVLKKAVAEAGVNNSVTFIPRSITGADKEALYAGARLFVLPSYSENFGNTVLEAMVRAIPVVVTEEVGAGEVVSEAEGGLVVDGSPESLSKAVKKLISDPENGKKMGESARRLVAEKYSWVAVACQMVAVYQNLLKARTERA